MIHTNLRAFIVKVSVLGYFPLVSSGVYFRFLSNYIIFDILDHMKILHSICVHRVWGIDR